jgi:hypothetical protein
MALHRVGLYSGALSRNDIEQLDAMERADASITLGFTRSADTLTVRWYNDSGPEVAEVASMSVGASSGVVVCESTAPFFSVVSGPCTLSADNTCVGRPTGYSTDEECTITVDGRMVLGGCPVFDTESGFDQITIDNLDYDGENCPDGVELEQGSTIEWASDGSVNGDGWEICSGGSSDDACGAAVQIERREVVNVSRTDIWHNVVSSAAICLSHGDPAALAEAFALRVRVEIRYVESDPCSDLWAGASTFLSSALC